MPRYCRKDFILTWKERINVKVGIVGGGAIGLLIAFYLHKYKYDVTIYTRRQSQAKLLNERGLRYIKEGREEICFVKAQPIEDRVEDADLLFITVKQYDLPQLISMHAWIQNIETVIFLQNGMGHLQMLEDLKNKNVLLGVVEHGALKHDDRTVEHTGEGKINLATWKGELGKAQHFICDSREGFLFLYNESWYEMLAMKLAVNAVINPLTALLRVTNGKLVSVEEYTNMMKSVFGEVKQVLQLPDEKRTWENIVHISRKTAANRSSMLKDLEGGRKTEVDAILGYVVEKGKSLNVPTTLCQFLLSAIKGMEHGGREDE